MNRDVEKLIKDKPEVQNLMIAYTALFGGAFLASLIIPKKILSKAIVGLCIYGAKSQVTDYYVLVESLRIVALSDGMKKEEQEIRNILEYFYERKRNQKRLVDPEDPTLERDNPEMEAIKKQTQKYYLYV